MPKKRRKLSKELEASIAKAKRDVELILAKINDIREEDIQDEYREAFTKVRNLYLYLSNLYDKEGSTEESNSIYLIYQNALSKFQDEFEI